MKKQNMLQTVHVIHLQLTCQLWEVKFFLTQTYRTVCKESLSNLFVNIFTYSRKCPVVEPSMIWQEEAYQFISSHGVFRNLFNINEKLFYFFFVKLSSIYRFIFSSKVKKTTSFYLNKQKEWSKQYIKLCSFEVFGREFHSCLYEFFSSWVSFHPMLTSAEKM